MILTHLAGKNRLHNCDNTGLHCNRLEGGNHSAQLHLALCHHSRTLYPIQLRGLE
jgi:hypothetical protein